MTEKTLYEILGVAPDATKKEIKAAYLRESSRHHPDKKGGTAEKFNEIKQAFDALYNDETRAEYDATGKVKPPEDEEQFVRQVIVEMIKNTLDHPDVHDAADLRRVMAMNTIDRKSSYHRAIILANKMIKKRQGFLDKIIRKSGGENIMTGVIERDINELAKSVINGEKGMALEFPEVIDLKIRVYKYQAAYQLPVRLRYRTSKESVTFLIKIGDIAGIEERAFDEVVKDVAAKTELPICKGAYVGASHKQ